MGGEGEGEGEGFFSPLSTFPPSNLLRPSFFFLLILRVYFTMVLGRYYAFPPLSLAYKLRLRILMSQVPHTFIVDSIWLKISSFFLEIMASHMAMSYGLQAAQMSEELISESSLALTLMQHLRDEEPEQREVRVRLEVDSFRAW